MSQKLKKQVQRLIQKKYFDFNLSHLQEKLEVDEHVIVKRETLRTWAHEIHHVKRKKNRRTKVRRRRDRMSSEGLMLGLMLGLILGLILQRMAGMAGMAVTINSLEIKKAALLPK